MTIRVLPAEVARCPGMFYPDEPPEDQWRDGCEDCLRRLSPSPNPERQVQMAPPVVIAFWCEYHIPSETTE